MSKKLSNYDAVHGFIGALILFVIFLVCVGLTLRGIDRVAEQQERIHGR